jgi:methyl acetate hydrolase
LTQDAIIRHESDMDSLQTKLAAAIDTGNIAGAVAMLGTSKVVTHCAVAGIADASTGALMQIDTIFQIASMTKAVTSVAAMQLVEQGKLTLDDPRPEFANAQVLEGFDTAGKPKLRPAKTPVTLRHILTHTSGLGYGFLSADMGRAQGKTVAGSLASITAPLLFDPGTRWAYGVSTDWAGRVIEAASGLTLGAYMQEHIFDPLCMGDTGFAVPAAHTGRRAALLRRGDDGEFAPFPTEIGGGDTKEFESGGGGLYSTAPDYMRFLRMLLSDGALDGNRILNAETIGEMARNQIGDLRAGHMESIMPQFSEVFDSFPDMDTKWGLGFLINPEQGPNGRAPGSLAWAGIANTYYWIDHANDIAGLIMMQFLPFGDAAALKLFAEIERSAYP